MKNLKIYLVVFGCAILLGLTTIAFFPVQSEADAIGRCDPPNIACVPWLVCTNHSGCNPGHWAIMYSGKGANCATCIWWDACLESCPPA